ncbi:MFS transporter [Lentibacter sp. XHP0401]|jgi:MFS transporter, DHA1 family, multidrug resistance protein|uniref:MFS transporter n=1 Tax=Lentibacter sp. XHP0401 TaxID=2984334 RepID=UPI0021E6E223|nr:MFS transporter [Lentibacter sp. XHP0401]MCV2892347.1 MFS transporter [Lentibacter sp. XHP0401]
MNTLKMSKPEFIGLMAMIFAMTAFSIDAMLPALPTIGQELSPDNINAAQLILTSFVLGMGIGTFFTGPLSDSFGRKPVIYAGIALYMVGAMLAWAAQTLELVLAARLVQGLGIAGPRIVSIAIIRDLFEGRQMAKLVSTVMMIFTLVPAIAPLIGAGIIALTGWRGIFAAFIIFAFLVTCWFGFRLEETLPKAKRRPFEAAKLWSALSEMLSLSVVRTVLLVQTFCFAVLFAALSSIQQIYDVTFDRADSFPLWFGFVAILAGSASILNAVLVVRLGMQFLTTITLAVQVALSGSMILLTMLPLPDGVYFGLFVFWQFSLFSMAGLTLGNLNAMAMEPLGHIAGLAASILGGTSTVFAMAFAIPIGLAFDGTPRPAAIGVFVLTVMGLVFMLRLDRTPRRRRH